MCQKLSMYLVAGLQIAYFVLLGLKTKFLNLYNIGSLFNIEHKL